MNELISISETVAWLGERDDFLIITHRRPDGDTLGSAGALTEALRGIGKTVYVLPNFEVTPRYSPCVEDYWAPDDFTAQHIIAVDTASINMFTKNALIYKDKISLCIDHHGSNTKYAEQTCLFDYASCGELIYEIILLMGVKISKKIAECLYVAVSTDTGCFSFGNTTAHTLRVASELVDLGADNKELNKRLFRTKSRERIKIDGMINSAMEFFFDGKVAIVALTRQMMEDSNASEDDIDDVSNVASSIDGVSVGITIRELTSVADCKISVRTLPPFDASEICQRFGGGGHYTAAGAPVAKTVDEIKEDLIEVLKDYTFE